MQSGPPGWPDRVPPAGVPGWEQAAVSWLLDQCPADYRAYAAWRLHVSNLVGEMGVAGEPGGLADTLLAPLSADLVRHRRRQGTPLSVIKDELELVVTALSGERPDQDSNLGPTP